MKHLIFILILFSSITLAFSQDKKTVKFIDEYLSSAFWVIQGVDQPIIKWNNNIKTLKYKIIGDFDYLNDKTWNNYLLEIKELTGIELSQTDQDDFEILIFFGGLNSYAKLTGNQIPSSAVYKFNNWSNRNWDRSYSLTKASFCIVPSKIKDDNEGTYRLKKGLLNSLGLLGELEDAYSIFYKYPASTNTKISKKDKRFIKLHYNQSIESGSNKEVVRQTLLNLPNIGEISKEKL